MKRVLGALLLSVALVLAVVPAHAVVHRTISYQGVLTDATGQLLPDGHYTLTVRLYDALVGGSLVMQETHAPVALVRGGFSILIGSVLDMSDVDFNRPLYLSLQVGADPEMAPRVPLASSPYAIGLNLPFFASDSTSFPLVVFRNKGTGPASLVEGTEQLGSAERSGRIAMRYPGASGELGSFGPGSILGFLLGGQMQVNTPNGSQAIRAEGDAAGAGGFFTVFGGPSAGSFTVDGNNGAGSPRVTVSGTGSTTTIDANASGDASVELPVGAILANEIGDEAGIAQNSANSFLNLTGGVASYLSRTITAPALGFVVVVATAELGIDHQNGSFTRTIMSASDNIPGSITGAAYTQFELPSTAPSGQYRISGTSVGVYPVAAGSHTFYMIAQEVSPLAAGQGFLVNPNLTLMFFPSAYGTVTPSLVSDGDMMPSVGGPQTAAELAAERADAASFEQRRVLRELSTMRERIEALQKQAERDPQQAAARDGR